MVYTPEMLQDFARRLRRVRVYRGYTQRELARSAGYSKTHIQELEKARRGPSLSALAELAMCLSVDEADLWPTLRGNPLRKRSSP